VKSKLAYWIPTVLLGLMMTMSGLMAVTRQPPAVEGYTHLGYPLYFLTILGVAKLLGVATLLVPGLPRLKEWAYAGFMINLVSAVASHLAVGDPPGESVMPLILLAVLFVSWQSRPASRRLAGPMF
jgi:uncharacterized membrane protein YphA (DoxX/SURF4 family)